MVVIDDWIENFYYYKEDLLWLQSMRRAANEDVVYELDPTGWLMLGGTRTATPLVLIRFVYFVLVLIWRPKIGQQSTLRSAHLIDIT
jgi:hypothetical protein